MPAQNEIHDAALDVTLFGDDEFGGRFRAVGPVEHRVVGGVYRPASRRKF